MQFKQKYSIKNFSIIKRLREENKSNEYFETMLGNIPLEDIIALKLELAYKAIGVPLYGFPIWKSMNRITKEAILKYAISISRSKSEAARYLGLDTIKFLKILKEYNIEYYVLRGIERNVDNGTTIEKNLSQN